MASFDVQQVKNKQQKHQTDILPLEVSSAPPCSSPEFYPLTLPPVLKRSLPPDRRYSALDLLDYRDIHFAEVHLGCLWGGSFPPAAGEEGEGEGSGLRGRL